MQNKESCFIANSLLRRSTTTVNLYLVFSSPNRVIKSLLREWRWSYDCGSGTITPSMPNNLTEEVMIILGKHNKRRQFSTKTCFMNLLKALTSGQVEMLIV